MAAHRVWQPGPESDGAQGRTQGRGVVQIWHGHVGAERSTWGQSEYTSSTLNTNEVGVVVLMRARGNSTLSLKPAVLARQARQGQLVHAHTVEKVYKPCPHTQNLWARPHHLFRYYEIEIDILVKIYK